MSETFSSDNLSALIQIQTSSPRGSLSQSRLNQNPITPGSDGKAMEAAQKFESLLIHNMLKGMRKTTLSENRSNERALYDDMLDEKLANTMIQAGGLGVAKQLAAQIDSNYANGSDQVPQPSNTSINKLQGVDSDSLPIRGSQDGLSTAERLRMRELAQELLPPTSHKVTATDRNLSAAYGARATPEDLRNQELSVSNTGLSSQDVKRLRLASELWGSDGNYDKVLEHQHFLKPLYPHAQRSAERLGTSPEAVLAIAALETGWGKSVIENQLGVNSHNLFGIKAAPGEENYAKTTTTEHFDGQWVKTQAKFRVFDNTADAVDGFANFVLENPRYANALKHASNPEQFLRELHTAGYATDPNYADKAIAVMRQIESHPLPL